MSRKRSFEEMTATGVKDEQGLDKCPGRVKLLDSVRAETTVLIKCPRTDASTVYYHLSKDMLRHSSGFFKEKLREDTITELEMGPVLDQIFELFLQWLFTRVYEELEASVSPLKITGRSTKDNWDLIPTHDGPLMSSQAKAAIGVIMLGHCLEAPRFQNHGIRRLYAAFSDPGSANKIHTATFYYIRNQFRAESIAPLLEDIVVRNWGDESIVEKDDLSWADEVRQGPRFRLKFVAAAGQSLEERRMKALQIEDYLVNETDD
ncbi:hypothetical protein K491DRAFT_748567 [Lophiostoma macrostomum CBS 122681]|uniref:BTB domain-containing protein n=1 Tax=Lophiostoma macrostomum CBS 122681 TaxID=1314788 RepID=A0A6A6T4X3_9PLEO|nr:hypothetical protein K491DRAFT_748567 [Lophiostoma macrostomum CBS 122681]